MAASQNDYFTYVGSPGNATTLASPGHTIGGTSINVGSTSNWNTLSGQFFAIDRVEVVNGVQTRVPGSYTVWEGVVSGPTSVSSMVLRYGTDQNYSAGANTRVYIVIASARENRIVEGLLNVLNQDATLKPTAIPDSSITTSKLASSAVTSDKINFMSYPGVAFYGNSESSSITVTPTFNGLIDIRFSMLTWGFGGGLYTAKINTPAGLTAVSDGVAGVEGGDTVNKMLIIESLFSGAQKGVGYTFTLTNISGTPGATNNRRFAVKVYQQGAI